MQRHHIVLTGCCANAGLHHAGGESQLVRGSNPARAVCAVFMAVQKHTTCFWHHQGLPQHCCAAATCECCKPALACCPPTGLFDDAAGFLLQHTHFCARPNAVKERRRKLHRVECATSTMTPRASNAIERGSLPYALARAQVRGLKPMCNLTFFWGGWQKIVAQIRGVFRKIILTTPPGGLENTFSHPLFVFTPRRRAPVCSPSTAFC